MKKIVWLLMMLMSTTLLYGCGSGGYVMEGEQTSFDYAEWEKNKRYWEKQNKEWNDMQYKGPPEHTYEPPPMKLPEMPNRKYSAESSEISAKMDKIAYLQSIERHIVQVYGAPNDVSKLNRQQRESLRTMLLDLKQQVCVWNVFNEKELQVINARCDRYLFKLATL